MAVSKNENLCYGANTFYAIDRKKTNDDISSYLIEHLMRYLYVIYANK